MTKDATSEVHDRMPAYLPDERVGEWLARGKLDAEEQGDLRQGLGEVSEEVAKGLLIHPVSRDVSNVRKIGRTAPSHIDPMALV